MCQKRSGNLGSQAISLHKLLPKHLSALVILTKLTQLPNIPRPRPLHYRLHHAEKDGMPIDWQWRKQRRFYHLTHHLIHAGVQGMQIN